MIIFKLKPWVELDGIRHVSTTYQVATDSSFTNIIDNHENDSVNLNLYYSPVPTPVGITLYSRYKRNLNNTNNNVTSSTSWSNVKTVYVQEDTNLLIPTSDITIDEPIVFVDTKLVKTSDSITIETSEYYGVGDGHHATHWIITDYNNNVLYINLNDTVNKTKLVVDKQANNLRDKNTLIVRVIHLTATGIESKVGSVTLDLHTFNFEFASKMNRVIPYNDYTIVLTKLNNLTSTNVNNIEIKNPNTLEIVWTKTFSNTDVTTITIPGNILVPSINYIVDINAGDINSGYIGTKRKQLTTVENNIQINIDNNYSYSMNLSLLNNVSDKEFSINTSFRELYNVGIPTFTNTSNAVELYKYNYVTNMLEATGDILNGVSLLTNDNDNTYFEYREDNRIVIDTLGTSNKPTFLVYTYDVFKNLAILENSIERLDETTAVGYNNAIVRVSENIYYYIPVGKTKLMSLDINTMVLTVVLEFPEHLTNGTLINIGRNRLLIIGGTAYSGYIFNMETNTITDGVLLPLDFRGVTISSVYLRNGDSVLYKTEENSNTVLYYSEDEGTLLPVVLDGYTDMFTQSSITLLNNEVLLLNSDNNYYKFS